MHGSIAIERGSTSGRTSMQSGQPSRTALAAAVQRAAHHILDGGRIFHDPFARVVLGPEADVLIEAVSRPIHPGVRCECS